MEALFPLNTGISELRGIIKLVKENGGSVGISRLAKETKRGIDVLLPAIEACRTLGICNVKDGAVSLTGFGAGLTASNIHRALKAKLAKIDPFMSATEIAKLHGGIKTKKLAEALKRKGIVLYAVGSMNEEMLRTLLLKWAVRLKLLSYDLKSDSWSTA